MRILVLPGEGTAPDIAVVAAPGRADADREVAFGQATAAALG